MIRPLYAKESTIAGLRVLWARGAPPSLFLPDAIDKELAEALREGAGEHLVDFWIADRGRWSHAALDGGHPLFAPLIELASKVSDRPLHAASARLLRFTHRDYALFRGDEGPTFLEGATSFVELTADLSARSIGQCDLTYDDGGARRIQLPQAALSLSLVERDATLLRAERYVTHQARDAAVVRLRLSLVDTRLTMAAVRAP